LRVPSRARCDRNVAECMFERLESFAEPLPGTTALAETSTPRSASLPIICGWS
jgi:hypothetical protein